MTTAFSALVANTVFPTPATPWVRIRGGDIAVVDLSEASEMAISGSP